MNIDKALEIAVRAHAGQIDKQGQSYILHPLRVMLAVDGDVAKMVAVLHDVLEDTTVGEQDLRDAGFSGDVIVAVETLTRRREETYREFILRISKDRLATVVKLADLEDNLSPKRILMERDTMKEDMYRVKKYALAHKLLSGKITVDEYLK